MAFSYTPQRLKRAREDILLIHRNTGEMPKMTKNEELQKLILSLVALEKFQIKIRAHALSDKEMDLIAGYIPHNYFSVDMKNLFQIFSIRSNDRLCRVLFNQWQDSYYNRACNSFMQNILVYDEHLITLVQKNNMTEVMFNSILQDADIAYRFGKELQNKSITKGRPLVERLAYFGIRDNSRLAMDCEFLYYTFCDKEDYIAIPKISLLNLVQKYNKRGQKTLKEFLRNFLLKLELRDLINFRDLSKFLQTVTGDNASNREKFESFFLGFESALVTKYINWINLYKVEEYFGNDERSRFWKKYRFVSVQKYIRSNAVVMKFESYYAVEFLGQAMGPIYIYTKDYFETSIKQRFNWYDNHAMRQQLLHYSTWFYRQEHRQGWQEKVHSKLIYNRITERLEF